MKKIIFALITIFTLVACSDEDNKLPYPSPSKAIEMQIEDIVGTYRLIDICNNNLETYPRRPRELHTTFNADFTGEEFFQKIGERYPITWKYENKRLIYTSHLSGEIEAWFVKKNDYYYYYYRKSYTGYKSIYTHEYVKFTEANN